jgi:hypothetical protein
MLVGPDEDDGATVFRDLRTETVLAFEWLWDADSEQAHQLVDCGGRSRTDENHDVFGAGVHGAANDVTRLLAQARHDATGRRHRGVRIGIIGLDACEPTFNEMDESPARGEIRVIEQPTSEGRHNGGRRSHFVAPDEIDDFVEGGHVELSSFAR